MCFNYIYQITILKVEKLFIPFLVSCVTGGKIVLISKVNFVLLRFKQDFIKFTNLASEESYAEFQSKSTDSQEHDFLQANTYSNPSPF